MFPSCTGWKLSNCLHCAPATSPTNTMGFCHRPAPGMCSWPSPMGSNSIARELSSVCSSMEIAIKCRSLPISTLLSTHTSAELSTALTPLPFSATMAPVIRARSDSLTSPALEGTVSSPAASVSLWFTSTTISRPSCEGTRKQCTGDCAGSIFSPCRSKLSHNA